MCTTFRIFRREIVGEPVNIDHIVKAACVLHNFIRKTGSVDDEDEFLDMESCLGLGPLSEIGVRLGTRNATALANNVRDNFKDYFVEQHVRFFYLKTVKQLFISIKICISLQNRNDV